MMILNAFLGCCEFLILIYAREFWQFAAAVFLAGIGRSACSGSENALLYDSLLLCGQEQSFEKYVGRLNAFDFSAVIVAAMSGSFLTRWFNFELNYWISVISMFISFCISLILVEPDIKSKTEGHTNIKINEYVKESLGFFKANEDVCLILISGMVTGAALNFLDEFWQLYVSRLGFSVVYFGLIGAAFMAFRLPGSMLAYILKKRLSYRTLITFIISVFTAGFLYISIVRGFTSLVIIFLICTFSGIIDPLSAGYLHHKIDSSMRATIDSFQSLGLKAILAVVGLGFGFVSKRFDIFGGYGFISGVCGGFLIFFVIRSLHVANIDRKAE